MLAGNKHRDAQLHLLDCSDGDSSTPGRILPKRAKPLPLTGIVGMQGTHHIQEYTSKSSIYMELGGGVHHLHLQIPTVLVVFWGLRGLYEQIATSYGLYE